MEVLCLCKKIMKKSEPLYRKEKKTGLSTHYYVITGGDYRHTRNSKKQKQFDGHKQPMNSGKWGVDYTPLYRYLLSKVGQIWDEVYSEVCKRLPVEHRQAINYMVVTDTNEPEPYFRYGENSYFSTLTIKDGILVKVDGEKSFIPPSRIKSVCNTYSFNGKIIK